MPSHPTGAGDATKRDRCQSAKASAGQPCSHPLTILLSQDGHLEFRHRLMPRRQTGRKEPLVPVAGNDPPAVARQFVGEVLAPGLRSRWTVAVKTRGWRRRSARSGRARDTRPERRPRPTANFRWRGGTLISSRRIRPSRTAASPDGRPPAFAWGKLLRAVPGIAGHDLDMPVHREAGARVQLAKAPRREARKVVARQCCAFG
jgi:hypothetical protein